MLRFSLGSWSSCLRMYSQSFLVSSVRGSGSLPTTAASAASGCTGLLRAFLGEVAFFGVGIGQLERAGLGSQAKNQPCFSASRERFGESQPIVLGPFIRELISFGNTHDPTSQRLQPHQRFRTLLLRSPTRAFVPENLHRLRGCLKSPDSVKFGDYTRSFQLPNTWAESYARTLSVEISGLFKHPLSRRHGSPLGKCRSRHANGRGASRKSPCQKIQNRSQGFGSDVFCWNV